MLHILQIFSLNLSLPLTLRGFGVTVNTVHELNDGDTSMGTVIVSDI